MPRPRRGRRLPGLAELRDWPGAARSLARALPETLPRGYAGLDDSVLESEGPLPYPGIDLVPAEQRLRLTAWATGPHQELFARLRSDREINTHGDDGLIQNGQYPTPDAEVYAAMVLDSAPSRVVEIGSGFSTRVARRTIEFSGGDTELVVVDPEPRADVAGAADHWHRRRVEELPEGDDLFAAGRLMLFIDSSHVVRAGGDVPYLFNQVLPALPAGTLVHVHDVFLPYEYPDAYKRRLYGEQYMLGALLAGSSRFRVAFATHYMLRTHPDEARAAFGSRAGSDPRYLGASFWFQVTE